MIQAFLPQIIPILNLILGNLVVFRLWVKVPLTIVVFSLQIVMIFVTFFDPALMTPHMIAIFSLTTVFTAVLFPLFGIISGQIFEDVLNEQKNSQYERESFDRMFDGLQQGIIVIQ